MYIQTPDRMNEFLHRKYKTKIKLSTKKSANTIYIYKHTKEWMSFCIESTKQKLNQVQCTYEG